MSRRAFLRGGMHALVCLSAAYRRPAWRTSVPLPLLVLVLDERGEGGSAARAMGVTMGSEEADRSARLFGGSVVLASIKGIEALERRLAAERRRMQMIAVIGGETPAACAALADRCATRALYLNVSCTSDQLRGSSCRRSMFHVVPSDAMIDAARAQSEIEDGIVTAWDGSLRAFGADTLNARFRARFGTGMTGQSWTGWFAVKATAEALMRMSRPSLASLIDYLESDGSGFDGHKGRMLSFRAWDHQLRQPLYVASSQHLAIVEVPATRHGASESSRTTLDALGTGRAASACHFPSAEQRP